MPEIIETFATNTERLAVLAPCIDAAGDEGDADWPGNILSVHTVVYESGRIARANDVVRHAVSAVELDLCRRLAREARSIMRGVEVGMGSEASAEFAEFYVATNVDAVAPERLDEDVVRRAFGGTIFPPASITVEPLVEGGTWWSEVCADGEGQSDDYFRPWRALMTWFRVQTELRDAAFVRIGDSNSLSALSQSAFPEGTERPGCVLPRLVIGLTRAGSLAGLFGYVVQT